MSTTPEWLTQQPVEEKPAESSSSTQGPRMTRRELLQLGKGLAGVTLWGVIGGGSVVTLLDERSLQEAKRKINGSDIVLLDLMLPDSHNPIKTIKEINKAGGEIPIIVVTCDKNPELMYKSVRFGVKDYLLKETVTPKKIGDSIKRVSEKNSLMKLFKEKSEALLDCCNQMVERVMAL